MRADILLPSGWLDARFIELITRQLWLLEVLINAQIRISIICSPITLRNNLVTLGDVESGIRHFQRNRLRVLGVRLLLLER